MSNDASSWRRSGFARAVGWLGGGKMIGLLAGLLSTSLITHIGGIRVAASYFLALSVVAIAGTLAQLGTDVTVIPHLAKADEASQNARGRVLRRVLATVSGAALVPATLLLIPSVGDALAEVTPDGFVDGCRPWLSLWILGRALQLGASACFRALESFRQSVLPAEVFPVLLSMLGLVGLAATGTLAINTVLAAFAIPSITASSWAWWSLLRAHSRPERGTTAGAGVLAGALWVWGIQVLHLVILQSDLWVVSWGLTDADLAQYGVAMRLSLLAAVPLGFVVAIVAPRIARAKTTSEVAALESQLRSAAFVAAVPVAIALAALATIGRPAISLLFGASFAEAQTTSMVLVLGQLANACFGVCGLVLLLRGDARIQFALTLVAAAVNVGGGVWVVSRFGTLGVAWVACGTLVLTNVTMYALVRARHGLNTWLTPSLNRELFR